MTNFARSIYHTSGFSYSGLFLKDRTFSDFIKNIRNPKCFTSWYCLAFKGERSSANFNSIQITIEMAFK